MIKSITDADFAFYNVMDVEKNEAIPFVRWADDEKGEYDVFLTNKDGRFRLNESGVGVKFERHKGNIKLIKRGTIK